MGGQRVTKVTISLPRDALVRADRLAVEWETTRSGVVALLLAREEDARIQAQMEEGYRKMGVENLREAEESLDLTGEVVLRDD